MLFVPVLGPPLYVEVSNRVAPGVVVTKRAVDLVDAGSVPGLRTEATLPIHYSAADMRRARIDGQRVALLSPSARRVIAVAAVVGRSLDFVLLQSLSRLDEAALVEVIKELIGAQLLVEGTADRFAFRHALTRQAIYGDLLARERRAIHKALAVPPHLYRARGLAYATLGDFDHAHADYTAALDLARAAHDRSAEWQALLDCHHPRVSCTLRLRSSALGVICAQSNGRRRPPRRMPRAVRGCGTQ